MCTDRTSMTVVHSEKLSQACFVVNLKESNELKAADITYSRDREAGLERSVAAKLPDLCCNGLFRMKMHLPHHLIENLGRFKSV